MNESQQADYLSEPIVTPQEIVNDKTTAQLITYKMCQKNTHTSSLLKFHSYLSSGWKYHLRMGYENLPASWFRNNRMFRPKPKHILLFFKCTTKLKGWQGPVWWAAMAPCVCQWPVAWVMLSWEGGWSTGRSLLPNLMRITE